MVIMVVEQGAYMMNQSTVTNQYVICQSNIKGGFILPFLCIYIRDNAMIIWIVDGKSLSFEDWLDVNDNELTCMFAETGADRELDFDFEQEASQIYEQGDTPS